MKNSPLLLFMLILLCATSGAYAQHTAKTFVKAAPEVEPTYYIEARPPYDVYDYLHRNMNYPEPAREGEVQGRVMVQFMVDKSGNIIRVKVIRGIGSGCDEEAKRVVRSMPRWNPAICNNKPVSSVQMIPITFKFD